MTLDGFTIELLGYAPKGANSSRGVHWAILAKSRKAVAVSLRMALLYGGHSNPPRAAAGERYQVHFRRYSSGELDTGNLPGAYKQLMDAIVAAGILIDDNARITYETHSQVKIRRNEFPKTVVRFRLVPDGEKLTPWFPE